MPNYFPFLFARVPAARAVRWLGIIATLVMLALLAWLGAGIFWSLRTPSTPEPVLAVETDPARAAQTIASRHLFGEAPAAGAAVAKARILPDIKLRGVIAATRPGQPAVAVLAIGGKTSVSIREGDEAAPGVTVHRVYARTVELKRDGVVQSLSLPDRQPATATAPQPVPQAPERNPSAARKSS